MSHRMSPKTRVVFKFIFGLGIWSFLVLGFFKLNGDPVMPHQFQQSPINGRLLLNKDNRWTGNEATSTTTDRYLSPAGLAGAMAGVDEVLVDNRAGKSLLLLHPMFVSHSFPLSISLFPLSNLRRIVELHA